MASVHAISIIRDVVSVQRERAASWMKWACVQVTSLSRAWERDDQRRRRKEREDGEDMGRKAKLVDAREMGGGIRTCSMSLSLTCSLANSAWERESSSLMSSMLKPSPCLRALSHLNLATLWYMMRAFLPFGCCLRGCSSSATKKASRASM